jgi:peptidoglycan biosynthesis protein MviN/MurJ (putative lipid II flippase)
MKRILQFVAGKPALLLAITLLAGALFKVSAFAREAFITAHFGLTPLTDNYFSLQQLPLTLATFMFGAFSRAFTPAYMESVHEDGRAGWLPGLLFYSTLVGLLLTTLTLLFAPGIFGLIARSPDGRNFQTLAILCGSYLPIVFIGFCSAIWMSYGRSLGSMTLTGLPYLVMTLSLVSIFLSGLLGDLSLPISMTAGFSIVGACGLWAILKREKPFREVQNLFAPWRFARFRQFTQQLTASSVETLAYSASQFIMLYFLARAGTGAVSANNCATRIGMLGFSLLAQPLTLFIQARLCAHSDSIRRKAIRTYLLGVAICTSLFAGGMCLFRVPVIELIYMRGNFSQDALHQVADMLPAWLGYFVVLSMNAVASRYLFTISIGGRYTRNMLGGYALTNCLRLITAGRMAAPWIVWCAVIGEGTAFLFNLLACITPVRERIALITTPDPERVAA